MHAYQRQESRQTLSQGIGEYHAANPGLARGGTLSREAQHFFRCHDVVHVAYGCDTGLADEAVVKIASIFGTTAGFGALAGYRLHESRQIYRQLRVREVLRTIAHSVVVVPRTITRCRAQRARWPWAEYEVHLETPLSELRQTFDIVVAHGRAVSTGA